jgi:hypothetical protein
LDVFQFFLVSADKAGKVIVDNWAQFSLFTKYCTGKQDEQNFIYQT